MVIGKVDLVMWTKNGGKTLSVVLKQIEQVIPSEFVNNRIIVDDMSTDDTKEMAVSFGWQIVDNEGSGISDGANTALKRVETEYFISFEQDLFLTKYWWLQIPSYLSASHVAAANGIRLVGQKPAGLRKLQELEINRHFKPYLCESDTFGKTLDNTIYKTKIIRDIGGFPSMKPNSGVDVVLANRLRKAGFHWIVDKKVESLHIRGGLRDELCHLYWHGSDDVEAAEIIKKEFGYEWPAGRNRLSNLIKSPIFGIVTAVRNREPNIAYLYPLRSLYYFVGILAGSR